MPEKEYSIADTLKFLTLHVQLVVSWLISNFEGVVSTVSSVAMCSGRRLR